MRQDVVTGLKRGSGLGIALVTAGVILAVTLTPGSRGAVGSSGPWCFMCGEAATVDAIENFLLFFPLGASLALAGWRWRDGIGVSLLLSASIEFLQLRAIPGRDASLADLVFNTLGATVGFMAVARSRLLLRRGRHAVLFPAAVGVAWLLLSALGSLGFVPAPVKGLHAVVIPAARVGPATEHALEMDGMVFRDLALVQSDVVHALFTARRSRVVYRGPAASPSAAYHTIVRLAPREGSTVALGRDGRSFHCARRVVASALRLRTPTFVISEAFPPSDDAPGPVTLECTRDGSRLLMRAHYDGRQRAGTLALTPGLGWAMFAPAGAALDTRADWWRNVAWLFVLALPLGLWAPRTEGRTWYEPVHLARWTITLLLIVAFLVVVPPLAGAAPSPWWEVLAGVAGYGCGVWIWRRLSPYLAS